jgi:hypothetical protein
MENESQPHEDKSDATLGAGLVCNHMQSDNHQDNSRCQGCRRDKKGCQVLADLDEHLARDLAQFSFATPPSQQYRAAAYQNRKRQSDQQEPKTDVRTLGVPHNNSLCCVRRFKLLRLQVAHKESGHEEQRRKNEQQLRCGNNVFEGFHRWAVCVFQLLVAQKQLTLYHKVNRLIWTVKGRGRPRPGPLSCGGETLKTESKNEKSEEHRGQPVSDSGQAINKGDTGK